MDPHQRLLLEAGFGALAVSGQSKASLMGSEVGVFLGFATVSDWGLRQATSLSKHRVWVVLMMYGAWCGVSLTPPDELCLI